MFWCFSYPLWPAILACKFKESRLSCVIRGISCLGQKDYEKGLYHCLWAFLLLLSMRLRKGRWSERQAVCGNGAEISGILKQGESDFRGKLPLPSLVEKLKLTAAHIPHSTSRSNISCQDQTGMMPIYTAYVFAHGMEFILGAGLPGAKGPWTFGGEGSRCWLFSR